MSSRGLNKESSVIDGVAFVPVEFNGEQEGRLAAGLSNCRLAIELGPKKEKLPLSWVQPDKGCDPKSLAPQLYSLEKSELESRTSWTEEA